MSTTWYRDADGDGFGSAESGTQVACVPPEGFVLRLGDCDDADRTISPLASERCNGIDDDCNGRADFTGPGGDQEDDDADGFYDASCGGDDCDDANVDVAPGAPELEDLLDNDCDVTVDESPGSVTFWLDRDGDGWGDEASPTVEATARPVGRVSRGGDCDDGDAGINPAVPDACDFTDVISLHQGRNFGVVDGVACVVRSSLGAREVWCWGVQEASPASSVRTGPGSSGTSRRASSRASPTRARCGPETKPPA